MYEFKLEFELNGLGDDVLEVGKLCLKFGGPVGKLGWKSMPIPGACTGCESTNLSRLH